MRPWFRDGFRRLSASGSTGTTISNDEARSGGRGCGRRPPPTERFQKAFQERFQERFQQKRLTATTKTTRRSPAGSAMSGPGS